MFVGRTLMNHENCVIEVSPYNKYKLEELAETYNTDVNEIIFRLLTLVIEEDPDLEEYSF